MAKIRSDAAYEKKGLRRRGGSWTTVLSLRDRNGRRVQKRLQDRDPEEVLRQAAEWKVKSDRGELANPGGLTVGDLVWEWLEYASDRMHKELAPRTLEGYEGQR